MEQDFAGGGFGLKIADNDTAVAIGGNVSGGTPGSVLFVGAGSVLAQDNTNFFWDDTNNRLGLGTNTPDTMLDILNPTTTNAIRITQTGVIAPSRSVGGALLVSNGTTNTGNAAVFYSNVGITSAGRIVHITADNVAFAHEALFVESDSLTTTTFGIIGRNLTQGVIKLTHVGDGTSGDANASCISLDLTGTNTAAQGIFTTSTTGGTTGKILNLRNNLLAFGGANAQVEIMTLSGDGILTVLGAINGPKAYVAYSSGPQTLTNANEVVNCTAGTFTVNLPTAVGNPGRTFTIKNSGTGVITIDASTTETIDGSLTQVLGQRYLSLTVVSDGANWMIV